jgi:hypothetical protein
LIALRRFYVVTDVTRPASGYSQTWYPHLIRAKCEPLVDSQEFKSILDADSGAGDGSSLRDLISTYSSSIAVNQAILDQADADAPKSGYDTTPYFVIPVRDDGTVDVADTTTMDADASSDTQALDASMVLRTPDKEYYVGYLTDDARPPNGAPFTSGVAFPSGTVRGAFHLRTDFFPNRLFRYDGNNWVKFEDNVRMTLNNFGNEDVAAGKPNAGKDVRNTQLTSFINNNTTSTIAGQVVKEKQALSKALRPQADN